jgi:XTP/dITP diphosphohydrolase
VSTDSDRPALRLLLATTNRGKTREIVSVLRGLAIDLVTLADLPPIPAPEETGRTFMANATAKAVAYWRGAGHPTVAEDSGLEIDALDGRPGVESARYPGDTYAEKFDRLYHELARHRRPWTARFVCALAFVERDAAVAFQCQAAVEGEITPVPEGTNGFGYDPIFYYAPYRATLAQVDRDRKLAVSHRGQAFREFRGWLEGRTSTR